MHYVVPPGQGVEDWCPPTVNHSEFVHIFNDALAILNYEEHELARAPGLERDARRLIYDERKDTAPGYLYVFQLQGDSENFFKIGYTKNVDARYAQWSKVFQPYGQLEMVLLHQVNRARFAERAVHLLLAPHRLARFLLPGRKIYTEYFYAKSRNGALPETQFDVMPDNTTRSHKREVEWFHVAEPQKMLRICADVVAGVNALY
jgi:hypothetical protein